MTNVLGFWMQWFVIIWVKMFWTKKQWRRSAELLWNQFRFCLQMNCFMLWFIALRMLGTMIRIPLFVAIHPLAQFPSRALLLFFQTVDILYTDHSFFFFFNFWSGLGEDCSGFSFRIWFTLFNSSYSTTTIAYY